jgi:hypothetical protein
VGSLGDFFSDTLANKNTLLAVMPEAVSPLDTLFLGSLVLMNSLSWNDARMAWVRANECRTWGVDMCDDVEMKRRNMHASFLYRFSIYYSIFAFIVVKIVSKLRDKQY